MTTNPNTEAGVIADLAIKATGGAIVTAPDGRTFLVTAPDAKALDITNPHGLVAPAPVRIKQGVTLQTVDSLVDYVTRFKGGNTVLFADITASRITALIDYHGPEEPAHVDHMATLSLPFSEEWKTWTSIDGKLNEQLAFARFLEENAVDVVTPSGAELLEVCRDLQAVRKVDFRKAIRTSTDNENFEYTDETEARTMPIRFSPMTTRFRMLPFTRIQAGISGSLVAAREAEQRAEAVERVVAAVEAEGELVEVGLQVLGADAVVRPTQPRLQVREHHVDHRQVILGDLRVIVLGTGQVFEPTFGEAAVGIPAVRHDHRSRRHGGLHEATQRFGGAVGHNRQADAPGDPAALALVQRRGGVALADLDGAGDKRLVVNAPAFPARLTANPGFIDLDVILNPTDPICVRADHSGPQLVQDLEGGLVSGQAELPLELDRRHARRLAGHKVGRPEPHAQRGVRPLHDRADRQPVVFATLTATQYGGSRLETKGVASGPAMGADEALAPLRGLQIGGTRSVVGEQLLKLGKRTGERKVGHIASRRAISSSCACEYQVSASASNFRSSLQSSQVSGRRPRPGRLVGGAW